MPAELGLLGAGAGAGRLLEPGADVAPGFRRGARHLAGRGAGSAAARRPLHCLNASRGAVGVPRVVVSCMFHM